MDLRARRRAATMRHVQTVALDLFERHGYDAVPVARVAAAAEVAERTVYRHFGTKESLALHDDADAAFLADVVTRTGQVGVARAVHAALDAQPEQTWDAAGAVTRDWLRKLRLMRSTPALRAAAERMTSQLGDTLGAAEAAAGVEPFVARARCRAVAAALTVAVEEWADGDGRQDLPALVRTATDAVVGLAATTLPPGPAAPTGPVAGERSAQSRGSGTA
ncbi:TetR family transcriptional regulator [Isoptericola aurantiacus]|uniref:TetR family transcriptional regulator n=1 Tax=Isoptericola aurantiacus TaxID=3377839 RepID=UPI00383B2EC0